MLSVMTALQNHVCAQKLPVASTTVTTTVIASAIVASTVVAAAIPATIATTIATIPATIATTVATIESLCEQCTSNQASATGHQCSSHATTFLRRGSLLNIHRLRLRSAIAAVTEETSVFILIATAVPRPLLVTRCVTTSWRTTVATSWRTTVTAVLLRWG